MISVIYRNNCDDSFASSYLLWLKYKNDVIFNKGLPHKQPRSQYYADRDVYIINVNYEQGILNKIIKEAKSVKIFDFNSNQTQKSEFLRYDPNFSSSVLLWKEEFENRKVPLILDHIQDNTLRKFKLNGTVEFISNLRSYDYNFDSWKDVHDLTSSDEGYEEFLAEGEAITRYYSRQTESILYDTVRKITLNGITGLSANIAKIFTSTAAKKLARKSGTFGLAWYIDSSRDVRCAIRSFTPTLDVSEIAKSYGGGGHPLASGFKLTVNKAIELGII